MGKDIKGINIEIGASTTQFDKAMKELSSSTRSTQNELKAVDKALKLDPKNVDLLKQKEELLGKQIEDVRLKVDKMKSAKAKADKEMADGTEVNQEQYRALVREISKAEGELKNLEKQNKDLEKSTHKVGETVEKVAKKGEAAGKAILGFGTAAIGAMSMAAEGTREYREDMDKLEIAFKTRGFSAETAKKSYEDFFVILGESDRSVEAVNHLAELAKTEEELAKWGNIAAGVNAKFGDSLPIEGLTEAANETAKVGQVTGVFADTLNWVSADSAVFTEVLGKNDKALKAFNKAIKEGANVEDAYTAALKEMSSEEERSAAITDTLSAIYGDIGVQYKELNADVIANRKATSEANDEMAKMGEVSEQVNTKLEQAKTTILKAALPAIEKVANVIGSMSEEQIILVGTIGGVLVIVPKVVTGIKSISTAMKALKTSTSATSGAMKALPIIGTTVAVVSLIGTMKSLFSSQDKELEQLKELRKAHQEELNAYKERKKASQEGALSSISELNYCEKLKEELESLADESGRVSESDRTRAEIILGQLNDALGTEYKMTGDIIDNYQEMVDGIDAVIEAKKAEALVSSKQEAYKEAIANIEAAKQEYEAAKKVYIDIQKKYHNADNFEKIKLSKELKEKEKIFGATAELYYGYLEDIEEYEQIELDISEKGTQAVLDEWSKKVGIMTSAQRDAANNYNQAIIKLEEYATNYTNGVKGFTAEGLAQMQQHVLDMKTKCEEVGVAVNEGIAVGVGSSEAAETAIDKLCESIPQWCKDVLGINSPAKKTIPIGEAIDEGIAEGIKHDMSAEEAIEKKCKNLESILKKHTELFDVSMDLAESEYDLWLAENPNATDSEKQAKKEAMLNKQYEEQGAKIQAVNEALLYQIQLTGAESKESEELLIRLNKEKIAYIELADAIKETNAAKGSGSGYVVGGSPQSKYAEYHVQYGALLKAQGVSQADVDAAARKYSGYTGEGGININYNISGTTPDTAYKVSQDTTKTVNNLAMQGVL